MDEVDGHHRAIPLAGTVSGWRLFTPRRPRITIQQILVTAEITLGLAATRLVKRTQEGDENPQAELSRLKSLERRADLQAHALRGMAAHENVRHFRPPLRAC